MLKIVVPAQRPSKREPNVAGTLTIASQFPSLSTASPKSVSSLTNLPLFTILKPEKAASGYTRTPSTV